MATKNAILLRADSDFQTAGKQHIGRVTGPDSKWGVKLEFVGRRYGKRNDCTDWTVIDPGLYKIRSTTRKRTDDTYVLIWDFEDVLFLTTLDTADVLRLAKGLTLDAMREVGRRVELADLIETQAGAEGLDPEQMRTIDEQSGVELGLEPGEHPRRVVMAARARLIERLSAPPTALIDERLQDIREGRVEPVESAQDAGERVTLQADRLALEAQLGSIQARLAEIDARLAEIDANLGGQ